MTRYSAHTPDPVELTLERIAARRAQVKRALEGFTHSTPKAVVDRTDPTYRRFREIAEKAKEKHNERG